MLGDRVDNRVGKDGHHRITSREHTKPRDESKGEPKGVTGDNTKIGPFRDVLVTGQYGRYGIEVLIDSSAKDGSQGWVVLCRSVDRDVTELSTECTQPMHADINANMAQRAQSSAASQSNSADERIFIDL